MSSTKPASMIPATLLTGFLGSGKTTVLNHVLKQPGMAATAVIVNEFGEIGLDHLLVERSSEYVVLLNLDGGQPRDLTADKRLDREDV
jgi:G3E family GTPase